MGLRTARPALGGLLLLLLPLLAEARNTTELPEIWVTMPILVITRMDYHEASMNDTDSSEYQELAIQIENEVTPLLVQGLAEQHVITAVQAFQPGRQGGTNVRLKTTTRTGQTEEENISIRELANQLMEALKPLKTVAGNPVTDVEILEEHRFVQPFAIPTVNTTTVREKRSTTSLEAASTSSDSATTAAPTASEGREPASNATDETTQPTTTATATEGGRRLTTAAASADEGTQSTSGGSTEESASDGGTQFTSGDSTEDASTDGGTQSTTGGSTEDAPSDGGAQSTSGGSTEDSSTDEAAQSTTGGSTADSPSDGGTQATSGGSTDDSSADETTQSTSGGSTGASSTGGGTQAATAGSDAASTTASDGEATNTTRNGTTTTVPTTAAPTTTETPMPVSAKLSSRVRITSLEYQEWMKVPFTQEYATLARQVESAASLVLDDMYGELFQQVAVTNFYPGSVIAEIDVTVLTDKTRAEDVDAAGLAANTTAALQRLADEDGFTFDPSAVETSQEIEVIEPTTPAGPTEDPYKYSEMKFVMRAPFANWTEELNDTDSEAFADMDQEVKNGIELMLSKKYPKSEWNITTRVLHMFNSTEADDEDEGVTITFEVLVEPQVANTSRIVRDLAKSFVYFNKLGTLQIAPDSVLFKDCTNYAPGVGMVVMDEDYLRALRKAKYNGSFVGDYTTQPPTLRPVIKRHKGFVLGIAVPAFIGMMAAIGLLLICTTIAGAKKSDD